MSTPYPLHTILAGWLAAISALALTACPGAAERKHDGLSSRTVATAPPRPDPPGSSPPVLGPAPEPKHSVLAPGEALAADSLATDAELPTLELVLDIRLLDQPPSALGASVGAPVGAPPGSPLGWGAVEGSGWAPRSVPSSTLKVWLGGGRLRLRVVNRAFALEDGWELRTRADLVGMAVFLPAGSSRQVYRVVPPGALRSLLSERRLDVLPLAPSSVMDVGRTEAFGRQGRRTHINTTYGTLDLDQVGLAKHLPTRPLGVGATADGGVASRHATREPMREAQRDAGEAGVSAPTDGSREGAGEALCRLWLELIASERSVFGAPCDANLVPVRAEIRFVSGGGLLIAARSFREVVQTGAEMSFPPAGAQPLDSALPAPPTVNWSPDDALLTLRARGEPALVELVNHTPFPRLATLDGLAVAAIAPGELVRLRVRTGRYSLSFRTLLGEVTEGDVELDAPSRATTRQLGSTLPPPPSAMASVRNGP